MRALIRRFFFLIVMVALLVAAKRWFEAKPAARRSAGLRNQDHPDTSQQAKEDLVSPKSAPQDVLAPTWLSPQMAEGTSSSGSAIDLGAAAAVAPTGPANQDNALPEPSSNLVDERVSGSRLETSLMDASSDAEPAGRSADEAWEAELAFHVFRDQGAFDTTTLGPDSPSDTAEPLAGRSLAGAPPHKRATVPRESSQPNTETAQDDPIQPQSELAALPRQALFQLAREGGLSPDQGILMSREQLLEVVAAQRLASQAVS